MGLRDFDAYSKAIAFTYKGKGAFDTNLGGICTILTNLLIALYGIQQILGLFISPNYSTSSSTTYTDYAKNTEKLILNTLENTIAVRLVNHSDFEFDIDSLVRIQFHSLTSEVG